MNIEDRRALFLAIADRQMEKTGGIRLADYRTRFGYAVQKRWLLKILKDNYAYEPPIIPELYATDDRDP